MPEDSDMIGVGVWCRGGSLCFLFISSPLMIFPKPKDMQKKKKKKWKGAECEKFQFCLVWPILSPGFLVEHFAKAFFQFLLMLLPYFITSTYFSG